MHSLEKLRRDALVIFEAGLKAADPDAAIRRLVYRHGEMLDVAGHRYDLSVYRNIYIVGAGKASARMTQAMEALLADKIAGGAVIVKYGYGVPTKKVRILEGGHPVPDHAGLEATADVIELVRDAGKDDLVFCLISGGGSALLSRPREGISLEDKQRTTEWLLKSGAKIEEINAVRKHISQVKGGSLARSIYPATAVSLIMSDVVDDPIETIASGPTAPDPSTYADCSRVLERYQLWERIPRSVRKVLEGGLQGELAETPKQEDEIFLKVTNVVVGNNRLAVRGAKQKARELAYHSCILSGSIEGEARDAALFHVAVAKEILASGEPISRPACLVSGGETTVTVRGEGKGGRNQEFALAAALEIDGNEQIVVLSGGTDGTDGPTNAAGGLVDGTTIQRAKDKGLDARAHLQKNDSYPFLRATDDLLITGPTFTNVMDLRLVLVG
ncbi:MAG: glycerate kinase type-2 family protein [Alphaproteobacteria bacterium]